MFTYHLETSIDINATPEDVWKAVTNFSGFNDWNPMLINVKARPEVGSAVKFEVLLGKGKPMKLGAKVTVVNENKALEWRGGSVLAVAGTHYFRITPLNDTTVRFDHGEYFSGLLLPVMASKIKSGKPLYESMNQALKKLLEE